MSVFNTADIKAECPFCHTDQEWRVQFKYGDCWQFQYKKGDTISWGGNDKGKNVGGHVRTDCIAENKCANCNHGDIQGWLHLRDNLIEELQLIQGNTGNEEYYERV